MSLVVLIRIWPSATIGETIIWFAHIDQSALFHLAYDTITHALCRRFLIAIFSFLCSLLDRHTNIQTTIRYTFQMSGILMRFNQFSIFDSFRYQWPTKNYAIFRCKVESAPHYYTFSRWVHRIIWNFAINYYCQLQTPTKQPTATRQILCVKLSDFVISIVDRIEWNVIKRLSAHKFEIQL